ncbi:MAG: hypothetical protein AAFX87_29585 [Bacteroidota bacterium]
MKKGIFQLAVIALIGLGACTEDGEDLSFVDATLDVTNTEGTFDLSTNEFEEVELEADEFIFDGANTGGRLENDGIISCATRTLDTLENGARRLTLDFGDGCEGPNGRLRTGQVVITATGRRFVPGSVITTQLINYTVNGIGIEGTRTLTNTTSDVRDTVTFNVQLEGGRITWEDGTTATREVNRTRRWVRNLNPLTDQLWVDGTASGTNRSGVSYEMEITSTLKFRRACTIQRIFIPVEGVKMITTDNRTFELDYGDGSCDNDVTVRSNGNEETITVDFRRRRRG